MALAGASLGGDFITYFEIERKKNEFSILN